MCSVCGHWMRRIFSRVNTDLVDRPRWSNTMGVNPRQIPQAVKLYPGSVYNEKGQLLIRNRKHKLFEMKRRGMVELE